MKTDQRFKTVRMSEFERFNRLLSVIVALNALLLLAFGAGFGVVIWFIMGVTK